MLAKGLLRRLFKYLADQLNLLRSERIPAILDIEEPAIMQVFGHRAGARIRRERRQAIERLDIAANDRDAFGGKCRAEEQPVQPFIVVEDEWDRIVDMPATFADHRRAYAGDIADRLDDGLGLLNPSIDDRRRPLQ